MPVVSHSVMLRTSSCAKPSTSRITSSTETSPSIGQPNTVDSETLMATPLPRKVLMMSRNCANDCSRLIRRLARLCVSLADMTRLTSSTRHDSARSAPRRLGTSTV